MIPKVIVDVIESPPYIQLICSMEIPEKEEPFTKVWTMQCISGRSFSIYKEMAVLISKSFETILEDLIQYEKYGIK